MEISVQRDLRDMSYIAHRPDFSWSYTDQHGHLHRWVGDTKNATVPTIESVSGTDQTEDEWYEWSDYPYPTHFECKQCRDRVPDPRMLSSVETGYIAGDLHYSIDGYPVTKDQYEEAQRTGDYPKNWPHPPVW